MNTPPFFEDFYHGQDLSHVPAVTITEGMTAVYQAMFGDQSRVFLDQRLSNLYSGRREMMVHPLLVGHVAIGQSTIPSQRVMGNLFYEGLVLKQPVHVGDTLITSTRVRSPQTLAPTMSCGLRPSGRRPTRSRARTSPSRSSSPTMRLSSSPRSITMPAGITSRGGPATPRRTPQLSLRHRPWAAGRG